jgi:hypothetical protein
MLTEAQRHATKSNGMGPKRQEIYTLRFGRLRPRTLGQIALGRRICRGFNLSIVHSGAFRRIGSLSIAGQSVHEVSTG